MNIIIILLLMIIVYHFYFNHIIYIFVRINYQILNKELTTNDHSVKSIFKKAKELSVLDEPEFVDLSMKYTNLIENCQVIIFE